MKKNFRYIVFLTLLMFATFGTFLSPRSSAAPERVIDPACVSECTALLFLCLSGEGKNRNENGCIGVYRHCIAQCKN